MNIRFRAADAVLSARDISAIRRECTLSISEIKERAGRSDWLFEIQVFSGDWPAGRPRVVRLLTEIESGRLPLAVSEQSDSAGEDEPLTLPEARARVQLFREIAIEQHRASQLEAGHIAQPDDYIPAGEDEA
ncbi:hypothetical protein [Duganella sp. CF458]|uniref:hypothetical protein n=1 Tax=Duganella sp. CF458 TaxID=1884368 RepID=UPI000B81C94E|nr:hypothetical protein [Duganella sp. CF458]